MKRNPDRPFEIQWREIKQIAEEIDQMSPVLLSDQPSPSMEVRLEPVQPSWLNWLVKRKDNEVYVIAANNGEAHGTAHFYIDESFPVTYVTEKKSIYNHK